MKPIRNFLLFVGLISTINLAHAQQVSYSGSGNVLESATDVATMLEAIESVPPVLFDPRQPDPAGPIWSAQHNPDSAEPWPPLPGNVLNLNFWPLGDGSLLLDDRNVDYAAIQAEADAAAAALVSSASPRMRMSMMMSSLASSYTYGNPVYLTNLTAGFAYDGSMTVGFDIGGGTNFVPYDILMTTNPVASPHLLIQLL